MTEIKLDTAKTELEKTSAPLIKDGALAVASFNRPASQALIEVLSSQQGMAGEALNRTLGKLNQSLDALLKGEGETLASPSEASSLQKLSYEVIARDAKLQERVAQALSSQSSFVRSRDAGDALIKDFNNLPPAITENSSTGTLLSKTILESLVSLTYKDMIGAGLSRDLSLKQVYVSEDKATGRKALASSRILTAAISYLESNQPDVLAALKAEEAQAALKESSSDPYNPHAASQDSDGDVSVELSTPAKTAAMAAQEAASAAADDAAPNTISQEVKADSSSVKGSRAQMSTAEIMTEYLKRALEEFPQDSTYLDIFKKNAQGSEGKESRNSERIREVIVSASQMAKDRNLYPGSPEPEIAEPETKPEGSAQAILAELKDDAQAFTDDPRANSKVEGSRMSLAELSARAAKLQMHFSRERQRMVNEGKLPDPAAMPKIDETIPQGSGESVRNHFADSEQRPAAATFKIPRSSMAALAQQARNLGKPLNQAPASPQAAANSENTAPAAPQAAETAVLNSPELEASRQELLKTQEELVSLKAELAKVQAEALKSAKETVTAQLNTQKELKAQAEAWYQSIQEAGAIAKNTIDALKTAADTALKAQEESQKLGEALKEGSLLAKLQKITTEDVQLRRPDESSAAALENFGTVPLNADEAELPGTAVPEENAPVLSAAAQSDAAALQPSTAEVLPAASKAAPATAQDNDPGNPKLESRETSLEERLYSFVDKAEISETADDIKITTALKLEEGIDLPTVTKPETAVPEVKTADKVPAATVLPESEEEDVPEAVSQALETAKQPAAADADEAEEPDQALPERQTTVLEKLYDAVAEAAAETASDSRESAETQNVKNSVPAAETLYPKEEITEQKQPAAAAEPASLEEVLTQSTESHEDTAPASATPDAESCAPETLPAAPAAGDDDKSVYTKDQEELAAAPAQADANQAVSLGLEDDAPEEKAAEIRRLEKLYAQALTDSSKAEEDAKQEALKNNSEAQAEAEDIIEESSLKTAESEPAADNDLPAAVPSEAEKEAAQSAPTVLTAPAAESLEALDNSHEQSEIEDSTASGSKTAVSSDADADSTSDLEQTASEKSLKSLAENKSEEAAEADGENSKPADNGTATPSENTSSNESAPQSPAGTASYLEEPITLEEKIDPKTEAPTVAEITTSVTPTPAKDYIEGPLSASEALARQLEPDNPFDESVELKRPTGANLNLNLDIEDSFAGSAAEFSKLYREAEASQSQDAAQSGAEPDPGSEISPAKLNAADLMAIRPSDELDDVDTLQGLKPLEDGLNAEVKSPQGEPSAIDSDELKAEENKPGFFSRLASFFR